MGAIRVDRRPSQGAFIPARASAILLSLVLAQHSIDLPGVAGERSTGSEMPMARGRSDELEGRERRHHASSAFVEPWATVAENTLDPLLEVGSLDLRLIPPRMDGDRVGSQARRSTRHPAADPREDEVHDEEAHDQRSHGGHFLTLDGHRPRRALLWAEASMYSEQISGLTAIVDCQLSGTSTGLVVT